MAAMAYDTDLAARVRDVLADEPTLAERKMFGGLAFLIDGRMVVAVRGEGGLMARVDPVDTPAMVELDGVDHVRMRGSAMKGWVQLDDRQVDSEERLTHWVDTARRHTASLAT
jgi:TfoX/Sxy family transcriptional regulator of competence genes